MGKLRDRLQFLPPGRNFEYPWRLYCGRSVLLTDTFQYSKLYGMESAERILSDLGEVIWDEPDADKKNRHFWVRRGVDFSGDMTEAYRWMTDGLLAMRNVYELLG